jgi:alpha-L-fucosidase 2
MQPFKLTRRGLLIALPAAALARTGTAAEPQMALWYRQPAVRWLDALPVGNGRLGAMVFGGVERDRVALNESTVWSGAASGEHENPDALEHLNPIRQLMFDGKYTEARDMCQKYLLGRMGTYGTHLPMADLTLTWNVDPDAVRDYRRLLDLDEAVARVEYTAHGARFKREYLASNPAQIMAVRITCDKPGLISFSAGLSNGELPNEARTAGGNTLFLEGKARETIQSDGKTGVDFQIAVKVLAEGGNVSAENNSISVNRAHAVTLLIAANTTYRNGNPAALCRRHVEAASAKPWPDLRREHVSDHQALFRRVAIQLGGEALAQRPTDGRLAAIRKGSPDPQLSALFFQYARYLLIAGSRQNSPLPTNLQGIWNDNLACKMGWTADFHLDINTEQNYWHAEAGNLSECHEPVFRLLESLREPGRRTARKMYGARGWVCHVFTNAWGFTAPGWGLGWGLHPTGGIWLASHFWEHYLYTGDGNFLAKRAYPVLKEAAEFFLDYMVPHPKYGWLVTGPAVSPENAFRAPDGADCSESMGPTCDRVLVYGLFTSCIEAARVLAVDSEFRARLEAAREKLPPFKIGRHGQLQEWIEDFDEAIPNHRHSSHLIALYPLDQITPRGTPALAQASRVTVERRIGSRDWEDVEWSRANLINFFARLGDAEAAHSHLMGLLREDTDANLLTFSRGGIAGAPQNIFAIDGNSAGAAGIIEMLLQSHSGEIQLLPALPREWPGGSVSGLRARGGFEVSLDWTQGALRSAVLRSVGGRSCSIRYREKQARIELKPGEVVQITANLELRKS